MIARMSHTAVPVCIVEDDEDIRMTLRYLLDDAGYPILEAANGILALEMLRSATRPMVVLLDLMLPALDGVGVLAAVAEEPGLLERHAYVLVTARRDVLSDDLASLAQRIPLAIIQKPFDIDAVLDVVAREARRIISNA
jgi:CheY-like chemotaxis protein